MPQPSLVSIVTPTFNSARYSESCWSRLKDRANPEIEHIVSDNGSRDKRATIELFGRHPNVKRRSPEKREQYPTLNERFRAVDVMVDRFVETAKRAAGVRAR